MLPLDERKFHHWIIPLIDLNVHQFGMLLLVERDYHHWMLHLVERNMYQGIPLFESGDQSLPLVESGNQGPMDTSNHVFLPLLERDGWKVLHVWLHYQLDWGGVPLIL